MSNKSVKSNDKLRKARRYLDGNSDSVTTLKLHKETKQRLEKLREHKRETYEDIIKKILQVLNFVRSDSDRAKSILERIDYHRKSLSEEEEKV